MGNSEQLAIELATSLSTLTSASSYLSNVSSSLSLATSSVTSITQKLEQRFKDLAVWEESLMERKKVLDELNAALDQREEKIKKEESEVMRKVHDLKEKEEMWEARKAEMKANLALVADTVTLNVGGSKFTISKQLLVKYNDSYFSTLFQVDRSNTSKFFIERDPKHFTTLLNFLREGKVTKKIKAKDIGELRDEFTFYKIPFPESEFENAEKTEVVGKDPAGVMLTEVVHSWIPKSHFMLLYKGSKDGFSPEIYHEKCDARGALLTLILSNENHLFGGYMPTMIDHASPGQTERHTIHPDSFLFTLTNPHNLPPTTFPMVPGNWPTLYTPFEHVHMGWGRWGYDLALSASPNTDNKSYIGFPFAFQDTTGRGKLTFTGGEYFTVRDIEVYAVVPKFLNDDMLKM
eukprot:Phypoly_transcript_10296.p1 GENE.Phypoly_transcript_10296~~Phypoly_transcript_10296.p1  ORF type:complete len:422 (+),score=81.02 Phypoly_transcript_10296:54-1268(+)